jgi:hypothetical protein
MTTTPIHLNGVAANPPAHGSGRIWPAIIISFLCLNAAIVAITVYFAISDKSVATEPDYYAKALDYNETLRQRETNERLGWHLSPALRPTPDGRSMELAITLTDRIGAPLTGAAFDVIAFAGLRSGQRQHLTPRPTNTPAGEYTAPIRIDTPGEWCFRISATVGPDTFANEARLIVPNPISPTSSAR